jgi:hypothetical protein
LKEKEEQKKARIERTLLRQRNEAKRKELDEAKAKKEADKEAKLKNEEDAKARERQGRAKDQKEFFRKQKE